MRSGLWNEPSAVIMRHSPRNTLVTVRLCRSSLSMVGFFQTDSLYFLMRFSQSHLFDTCLQNYLLLDTVFRHLCLLILASKVFDSTFGDFSLHIWLLFYNLDFSLHFSRNLNRFLDAVPIQRFPGKRPLSDAFLEKSPLLDTVLQPLL